MTELILKSGCYRERQKVIETRSRNWGLSSDVHLVQGFHDTSPNAAQAVRELLTCWLTILRAASDCERLTMSTVIFHLTYRTFKGHPTTTSVAPVSTRASPPVENEYGRVATSFCSAICCCWSTGMLDKHSPTE